MNMNRPVRVAVVGAGMISDIYLSNMITRFAETEVAAICSARMESAQLKAEKYHIEARTYEQILADESIEMIVNLTPTHAHEDIIRRALNAGKHVYTEKTLTMDHASARELCALAAEKGLMIGSAPDTFLGSALQNARRAIDEGMLGEINSFALASNRGNDYLRSFFRFLNQPGGGVGYDYAVYYLTAMVSLLGPAAETCAIVRTPYPRHMDINPAYPTYGTMIDTPGESQITALLRMRSGVCGTLHFNNESSLHDQAFMAVYGTKGILYLPNPDTFGGKVEFFGSGRDFSDLPERKVVDYGFGFRENSRGVGPAEMAAAIRAGRINRANSQMACHVLEIIDAMMESERTHTFAPIISSCDRPAPLELPSEDEAYILR